tara:strand:+ start:100 stop:426 length:327 start_codon:yes stop_codon:yes gene_type:complete
MADTLGDLIDKLSIANIRLWHVEDARREFLLERKSKRRGGERREEAEDFLDQVSKINKERNSLIDQINASLKVLVDYACNGTSSSSVSLTHTDILGHGKNKFYKADHD